jgi:DNA-directed RNA polymerase subunit RPC12/RpoP
VTAAEGRVENVVAELAVAGAEGFFASYVAREAEVPVEDAIAALAAMVGRGDLEELYSVACANPTCGRRFPIYTSREQIPFGEELVCGTCGERTLVTEATVLVSYRPSRQYLSAVVGERAQTADVAATAPDLKKKVTPWRFAT